jgi:hypothetical protein
MLDLILDVFGGALLFGQAVHFGLFADLPARRSRISHSATADRTSRDLQVSRSDQAG